MQRWHHPFWMLVLMCASWGATTSEAQQRNFGRPLQRQAGPQRLQDVAATAETAGGITGGERFLRESRRPGDFVGGDQASTRFVGSGAVIESGRVRSAVESLSPAADPARQVNRPLAPAAATQPYAPRLQLRLPLVSADAFLARDRRAASGGSESDPAAPADLSATNSDLSSGPTLIPEWTDMVARTGAESIQVRLEQRTVYLSGAVRDARQSQVAELMMSFQPGVSRVVNQIQVVAGE